MLRLLAEARVEGGMEGAGPVNKMHACRKCQDVVVLLFVELSVLLQFT